MPENISKDGTKNVIAKTTCKNPLLPAAHHHLGNTQIYRRSSHFRINHTAKYKYKSNQLKREKEKQSKLLDSDLSKDRKLTLGLKYS